MASALKGNIAQHTAISPTRPTVNCSRRRTGTTPIPANVKLWDAQTGAFLASLTAPVDKRRGPQTGVLARWQTPRRGGRASSGKPEAAGIDRRFGTSPPGGCLAHLPRPHGPDHCAGVFTRRQDARFRRRGSDRPVLGRRGRAARPVGSTRTPAGSGRSPSRPTARPWRSAAATHCGSGTCKAIACGRCWSPMASGSSPSRSRPMAGCWPRPAVTIGSRRPRSPGPGAAVRYLPKPSRTPLRAGQQELEGPEKANHNRDWPFSSVAFTQQSSKSWPRSRWPQSRSGTSRPRRSGTTSTGPPGS